MELRPRGSQELDVLGLVSLKDKPDANEALRKRLKP